MKNIHCILFFATLTISSCFVPDQYSKADHRYTGQIGDDIYLEYYRVDSYGVAGDVYSIYVTDSLKFRNFITVYYDSDSFKGKIKGDTIEVCKFEQMGGFDGQEITYEIREKYVYSRNELQNGGVMD